MSHWDPQPVIRLEKQFTNAYKNFLATARTCYSSKGIITEDDIDEKWDWLAKSLYKAGHHTTLQHAHFQFSMDNVSRHFVWSFLHSHPFYNSEQVSQRYVEVKPGSVLIPPVSGKAREIFEETVHFQMEQYRLLGKKLKPLVEIQYGKRFPSRALHDKRAQRDIKKKAQEIARYVLPVATSCYLYHTISGITLLRYYRLSQLFDTPAEQTYVVGKMVEEVLAVEPKFAEVLEEPISEHEISDWQIFEDHRKGISKSFIDEFDKDLDGHVSKLVDYKINNERVLADSVREVVGATRVSLSDEDAIELALNPGKNRLLGESLNLTTLSKLSRCMFHPSYTFKKKLSHTGDSQDQRHRMTPGSRPILAGHLTGEPDFITPELITLDDECHIIYNETMNRSWEAINGFKQNGGSDEFSQYLLPNAVSIRFTESADLLNLHHKHAMRLCYNAQEEIWRASLDEAKQISAINPQIGKYLLPPCTLRHLAKSRPICPEGDRFCGERVWQIELDEYKRVI